MRQFKFFVLLLSFLGIGLSDAFSYDIAVQNEQGITIYYNYINNGKELEVTRGSSNPNTHVYGGNIVIPETVLYMNRTRKVTSIGNSAFYYEGVTSVTIPNSVTTIGDGAFHYCHNLISVVLPDSITSIGKYAFEECSQLSSINLPTSLTSIEPYVFSKTTRLESITIPDNVTIINEDAFYYSGIKLLTIGSGVASIESSAFGLCTSLTSVVIPDNVKNIKSSCFYRCSSLESVTLGRGIRSIGECAFYECDNLSTVVSYIMEPFVIVGKSDYYSKTFSDNTFFNATLYVPQGTLDKYEATEGWKDFVWKEEFVPESETVDIMTHATAGGYILVNGERETHTSVEKGCAVTLEFVAEEGYILQSVMLNGEDITAQITNGTYIIAGLTEDIDVAATFEERNYLLTIRQADNGSLKQVVKSGACISCFIEPDEGWIVHSVVFNGVDVTSQRDSDGKYTTPAIVGDSWLSVVYELFDEDAISSVTESKARVQGTPHGAMIIGAEKGEMIHVYTADGKLYRSIKAEAGAVDVPLANDNTYIIQVGAKTVKLKH